MKRDEQAAAHTDHERASQLMAAVRVEGISASEREWLDRHLEACARCAAEADAVAAAIDSLHATPTLASAEMVRRTRLAVRLRAEDLRVERARAVPLWTAGIVSAACMLLTMPYCWWAFAWLGHTARVPEPVWQGAFVMWWFLPATVVAAMMAWRHAGEGASRSEWGAQLNRGES